MEFIKKVIKAFNTKKYKVLSWDSVLWAYREMSDIREASEEDVFNCHCAGFTDVKVGDYIVEVENDEEYIRPIGAMIAECDTIVVKEIEV